MMDDVEPASLRFAAAARALTQAARLRGFDAPTFRSPPGRTDVDRTIRRRGDAVTVSVRVRNRPWSAVLSDMIEGIVVVNGLSGVPADRARAALWDAVDETGHRAA
jgi:hypothetical protein